jgi:hypothetical protein
VKDPPTSSGNGFLDGMHYFPRHFPTQATFQVSKYSVGAEYERSFPPLQHNPLVMTKDATMKRTPSTVGG